MTKNGSAEGAPQTWLDLLRDGRAAPSILLNVGVVLHGINIMIVSTIMPSVVVDIGGLSFYAWPSMIYMVGSIAGAACGEPTLSALHQRGAYLLAAAIFGVGAVLSATAPSMAMLIAGQLVQGIGGGLLTALTMVLVHAFYDGILRTRILSVVSTTWSVAAVIGPGIGGIFAQMGWWRGALWFSVVVVAGFALAAWRTIPSSGRPSAAPGWPILRLLLIAIAVLCVGVIGQIKTAIAMVPLLGLAAALLWAAFRLDAVSEKRLFPSGALSVFSPVGTAYWVSFLLSFTHMAAFIFVPLILQVIYEVSPLWVGYFSTVFSISWTAGALAAAGWHGARARAAMFWGMIACAVSLAGMAVSVGAAPIWVLLCWITILGIGIGAANIHIIAWTMSAALKGEETVTASAMQAVRSLGIAFGAAISSLIVNSVGLHDITAKDAVAGAVVWVYFMDVIPAALAAIFVLRMLKLARCATA